MRRYRIVIEFEDLSSLEYYRPGYSVRDVLEYLDHNAILAQFSSDIAYHYVGLRATRIDVKECTLDDTTEPRLYTCTSNNNAI